MQIHPDLRGVIISSGIMISPLMTFGCLAATQKATVTPNVIYILADDNFFPIKQVLDAALLIGNGKGVIPAQIKLMSDQNQFIRYWASLGLYTQQALTGSTVKLIEQQLDVEKYLPAKVNLAVVLFKHSDKKRYIEEVRTLLEQVDPEIIRITTHLLLTLDTKKQMLLVDDIEQLSNEIKRIKVKNFAQPGELLTFFCIK